MTIKELYDKCDEEIKNGNENSEVYFDTCAKTFNVHLVKIKNAFLEEIPGKYFILYEE